METPPWLTELLKLAGHIEVVSRFGIDDLQVNISVTDPGHCDWIARYLEPLVQPAPAHPTKVVTVQCLHSDSLLLSAMRYLRSVKADSKVINSGGRQSRRVSLSDRLILDFDRKQGFLRIIEPDKNCVTLLYASRAQWPTLEIARITREIFSAYLLNQGWYIFHSGAIVVGSETWLVVGDGGQGKTSLIVALMSGAGRYLSNERVFVRSQAGVLMVRSFPMPIAIGMGTVLQYRVLRNFIHHPEYCLYPPRRLKLSTLKATPKSEWALLPDKLQLLPGELTGAMSCADSIGQGRISGIVVPDLLSADAKNATQGEAVRLTTREIFSTVNRNHIAAARDPVYPVTLPLVFDESCASSHEKTSASDLAHMLSALPGVRFKYRATQKNAKQQVQYAQLISLSLANDFSAAAD